jgi:hypothetical protein
MKVTVDTVTSTPKGLVLGVQLWGPADSWVRFAKVEIPWRLVGERDMAEFYAYLDRERVEDEEDGLQEVLPGLEE